MKETIKKVFSNLKIIVGAKMYYSIFAFGFFSSLVSLSEPFLFSKLINYLELVLKGGVFDIKEISLFISFWILVIIFTLIVSYVYRYYFVDINILKYYTEIRKKYSNILLNMTYNEYLKQKQGELYRKFDKGTVDQFNILFFLLIEIVKVLSGIIFIILILFILNWKMTLATISMLPVMFFMGLYFNKKTSFLQTEINDKENILMGYFGDNLTNLSLVKILSLEERIKKYFSKEYDKLIDTQYIVSKRWSFADVYVGILVMIARLITLVYGSYLVSQGTLSLGYLFLYFSFIGWVYFPLGGMFGRIRDIQRQLISIKTFYQDFDKLELDEEEYGKKDLKEISGKIEFRGVNFSYNSNRKILKNLNFEINPGEKIAFVGDTGSGKSTIVNLIFRLFEVNEGSILIDGIDIRNISKKSLRKHIGIVMQDNTLFNLSIKENLEIAREKSKKTEVEDALKQAHANFVFDLKDSINTMIGERGLKLSGGEKQRLSIARLFLKNPRILVLDEATSALDNKTEKEIQKSLDSLIKGRTSIIIAHRLTTIKHSDKIFVLEHGEIVETGSYEELIAKKGKFFALANPDKHLI